MTTSLLTTGNADFDDCFEKGSGTQLLYIYGQDGQDIGQRYLPVSSGSAYGTTGHLASSGTDVGDLLCKAGTADDGSVIMTVGYKSGKFGSARYGYNPGYYGSLDRVPYWGNTSNCLISFYIVTPDMDYTICLSTYHDLSEVVSTVNGIAIPPTGGDVFGLSEKAGQQIKLLFDPPPTGFL